MFVKLREVFIPFNSDNDSLSDRKLVFAFSGRSEYWPGMGAELYHDNQLFRNSINEINEIIINLGYQSILSEFQELYRKKGSTPELTKNFIFAAIQMALFDVIFNNGLQPDAVLGLSQGEITAIYAAGGVTKRDALIAIGSLSIVLENEKRESQVILVNETLSKLEELSRQNHLAINVILELSELWSFVIVNVNAELDVINFFKAKQTNYILIGEKRGWPYHTKLITKNKKHICSLYKQIKSRPLLIDFYSPSLKQKISKGKILDKFHFYNYQIVPVYLNTIFKKLCSSNGVDILQVGPEIFSTPQLKNIILDENKSLRFISTLTTREVKYTDFSKIITNLKKTNPKESYEANKKNTLEFFKNHFTTDIEHYIQNPYPYYSYLRANGKVHYLPSQNEYFITDFKIIKHVLETPEIFSSSPYSTFDNILLGADSKSHKNARHLLMPLFKQSNLKSIEVTVNEVFGLLMENLPVGESFNFVNHFSIPLVEKVVADFLGLPNNIEFTTIGLSCKHLYGLEYLEELHNFCERCLREERLSTAKGATHHLLFLENENKITRIESISLMRLLWVAATTTTSLSISYIFYRLLENDELVEEIRNNDSLINSLIAECLRIQSPESNVRRRVLKDTILDGVEISKEAIVNLSIRAANTDEMYFTDPLSITLDRAFKTSLAFGSGPHYCLGMAFAKLEIKVVIKSLLKYIDKFTISEENPTTYFNSNHFRGLKNLNVTYKTKNIK